MADPAVRGVPVRRRPSLALIVAGTVGLLLALPILGMGAVVVLSRDPGELARSLIENAGKIGIAVLVVAAAASTVGYAFWRGLTRPLGALNAQAERVAAGGREFNAAGPFGTIELARLGGSIATMVDELQRRSRTAETFSSHLAHELKSPLTSIRGAAELIRDEGDEMTAEQRARFLGNIVEDAQRLTALVERMRELARADLASSPGTARVTEALDEATRAPSQLRVVNELPADASLPMPAPSLAIVLGHLIDNAERHRASEVRIRPIVGGIAVENDGDPVPSGDREKVLEPFYTTRREEGGTGMGLAIAAALVAPAGGTLTLASSDPVRFELNFRNNV